MPNLEEIQYNPITAEYNLSATFDPAFLRNLCADEIVDFKEAFFTMQYFLAFKQGTAYTGPAISAMSSFGATPGNPVDMYGDVIDFMNDDELLSFEKSCDCGGEVLKSTHSDWCSTKK